MSQNVVGNDILQNGHGQRIGTMSTENRQAVINSNFHFVCRYVQKRLEMS